MGSRTDVRFTNANYEGFREQPQEALIAWHWNLLELARPQGWGQRQRCSLCAVMLGAQPIDARFRKNRSATWRISPPPPQSS